MMRSAVISGGIVANIVIAAEGWVPPEGSIAVASETANIGDLYADGVFTSPPQPEPEAPPVPDRLSARQFFLQLEAGGLLDLVEGWISAQTLPVQIAFERSSTFVRDDAMLQQGFAALGFTPEQIDGFFTAAAAL